MYRYQLLYLLKITDSMEMHLQEIIKTIWSIYLKWICEKGWQDCILIWWRITKFWIYLCTYGGGQATKNWFSPRSFESQKFFFVDTILLSNIFMGIHRSPFLVPFRPKVRAPLHRLVFLAVCIGIIRNHFGSQVYTYNRT